MTTEELQAAAAFMREPWTPADKTHEQLQRNNARWTKHAHVIVEAWLAEHPADDAEPVTEEWLRSVGFCAYQDEPHGVSIETLPGMYLSWGNSTKERHFRLDGLIWMDGETRGDVRLLCRALGITLDH